MSKTIIVWFRNDLRLHDHPALMTALTEADLVVPIFIFSNELLTGQHGSPNRNRFLIECLEDLRGSLRGLRGDLIIRAGRPEDVLPAVAHQTGATSVYFTADYTPFATKRDKSVQQTLESAGITVTAFPGRLIIDSLDSLRTKTGKVHKVFTPYYKNWLQMGRRQLAGNPERLTLPKGLGAGDIPAAAELNADNRLSPDVLPGGETAARHRLEEFLSRDLEMYITGSNDLATAATSRLSAYLHLGCISPLAIESQLPDAAGAEAWRRQLCWREFYHYIIYNFPANARQEFQERYRTLLWSKDEDLLQAWQEGKTGYPIVDAGMRQLLQEGFMHNRARLIVGSFLTKDLGIDWRLGERHFMQNLIDGDEANNNGNWQWIASVGVDPAPVFRRLYNPVLQQCNFDPSGAYVRRYVRELRKVPNMYLAEPWTMPLEVQREASCVIGEDYPGPIVDHKEARLVALEKYRRAGA